MTLAHLKVIGVMGRRDLHDTGSELHVHIIVFHHRNGLVDNRQPDLPSF